MSKFEIDESENENAEFNRDLLRDFGEILLRKNELLRLFDKTFKKQIAEEPMMKTLRKVFLPVSFFMLDETLELIREELARKRVEEKTLTINNLRR